MGFHLQAWQKKSLLVSNKKIVFTIQSLIVSIVDPFKTLEAVRTGEAVHACKHLKKSIKKDQACTACICEAPEGSLPGQIVQTS